MAEFLYHCKVCGHDWPPRKEGLPIECPNCHSKFWQTGPQRASRVEALAKAEERRRREQELLERKIPVSDEYREEQYRTMGIIRPIDDGEITVGVTNAGPWLDADAVGELPRHGMLDLMGYNPKTDTMYVINDQEHSGLCLTGDGLFPGDVIHFRKGMEPTQGDIVLAEGYDVNGHWFVTAKHYYKRGLRYDGLPIIELRPSNSECRIITVFPQNILELSVEISRTHRNLHKRRRRGALR